MRSVSVADVKPGADVGHFLENREIGHYDALVLVIIVGI
jgi:hypothetical protein